MSEVHHTSARAQHSAEVKHTHEHVEHAMIHDTYAVDEDNVPVTVLGTMGQDPDHQNEKISWRVWVIVALCALAQMQNTYISCAPASSSPLPLPLDRRGRVTDADVYASQCCAGGRSLLRRGLAKRLRWAEDLDHPGELVENGRSFSPVHR